jgi:hypothetical protein
MYCLNGRFHVGKSPIRRLIDPTSANSKGIFAGNIINVIVYFLMQQFLYNVTIMQLSCYGNHR